MSAIPVWRPTAEELRAYSGEGRVRPGENTHTSIELARAADLPDLIVQGHHTLAVGVELLRAQVGAGSTPATVAAKFIAPVFVDAELEFTLEPVSESEGTWKVTAREGERVALVAEVALGAGADGSD